MKNILHIILAGKIGGIERLCFDIANNSKMNHYFLFVKGVGSIYDEFCKNGFNVYCIYNDDVSLKISDVKKTYNKVNKLCKEKKIDKIIIHNGIVFIWLLTIKIVKKLKIETVLYAHSNADDFLERNSKMFLINKIIYEKAIKNVTEIIAISYSVKNSILKYFPSLTKIRVSYNGIDLNKFYSLDEKKGNDKIKIVYVGRLIKSKGIENIISLLSAIDKKIDFSFDIVGSGNYATQLKEIANLSSIKDRIRFLGESHDVASLLRNYDVFIHLPNWEEGFGITIIEAMASGLIVVCNDKGALTEIINDEKNGFVLSRDYESNVERLESILKRIKNGKCTNIVNQSIEDSKKFSIENTIMNLEE